MTNTVLHIVLPQGLSLTNGQVLMKDATIDVVSALTPFYCGIGQVKLHGGSFLRKTSDLTVACAIYNASQEADLKTPFGFNIPNDEQAAAKFIGSRSKWVLARAAKDLILNVIGLTGAPGAHVLANFSVNRERSTDNQSVSAKIKELDAEMELYGVNISSAGAVLPGGRSLPAFGAKGLRDFAERTPSRNWVTTGIGVNRKANDFVNLVGGRGKPMNYFQHVYFSPTILNYRSGIYPGGFPLNATFYLL